MIELRKDYILDRWVIISEGRGKRPKQFKKQETVQDATCFFCPGNESMTPQEIGRIAQGDSWKIRWFPNKFAAVVPDVYAAPNKGGLITMPAFGYHEVIAETSDHTKQLWDLSQEDLLALLRVYQARYRELMQRKNVKYVQVFKNHGREAGTSIIHTHTQLVTLPIIPPALLQEIRAANKGGKCQYCEIIKQESKTERKAIETEHFIAICPYASRFNYELWIFPKQHYKTMLDIPPETTKDLSVMMSKVLAKLKELDCAFNYYLHYAPAGKNFHFHIKVTPRMSTWAGFEFSSDVVINSVRPEDAAAFYAGKS